MHMRYVTGLAALVLAAGCSESVSPTSPTSVRPGGTSLGASPGADHGPSASSATNTVPFKGTLDGTVAFTVVAPALAHVVISASGTATELGRFTLEAPHDVDLAIAAGQGTYTFTAANGDRLTAAFTGTANTATPIFVIEEHATVTGGTGRFAGASGSFTANRLYDTAAGTTTGTFSGSLSVPGTR
jgi:hypothetical protein